MKPRILLVIILTLLLIPLTVSAKNPITWTPKNINQSMGLGGTSTVDVTFTSNENLGPIDFWIVPELQPFITSSETSFDVQAGETYSTTLTCTIPFGTEVGLYDGTIHVRSGSSTIPATLKVEIDVFVMETVDSGGGSFGATLFDGTEVELIIPGGALTDATDISISYDSAEEDVPDSTPLIPMINLGPDGTTFEKPITLTFIIPEQNIQNAGYTSLEECQEFISALYYNEEENAWDALLISTVNSDDRTISVNTNHFTKVLIAIGHYKINKLEIMSPVKQSNALYFKIYGKFNSKYAWHRKDIYLYATIRLDEFSDQEEVLIYKPQSEPWEFERLFGGMTVPSDKNGNMELKIRGTSRLFGQKKTCWVQKIVVDYNSPVLIFDDDLKDLLNEYSPKLFFGEESEDGYFPCSIEDFVQFDSAKLKFENGDSIKPTANLLSVYSSVTTFFEYDEEDYNYADTKKTVYTTAVEYSGQLHLMYIFFYAYDPKSSEGIEDWGAHKNDNERIVVILEPNSETDEYEPKYVVYGQHVGYKSKFDPGSLLEETISDLERSIDWDAGHVKLEWKYVIKKDKTHPHVYVAEGSHACYPRPGTYEVSYGVITPLEEEASNENEKWEPDDYVLEIIPRLSEIDSSSTHNWLLFSGILGEKYPLMSQMEWWLHASSPDKFYSDSNIRDYPHHDIDGDEKLSGDNPCTGGETLNCNDNCPETYNPDQADSDGDGIGDVCEETGPDPLAAGLKYPTFITVDQNNVYWTDEWVSIKKISLNGGAPATLKEGTSPPIYSNITNIAVDSSSVYWAESPGGGSGWINKIPIDKDPATPLDPPLAYANQPYDIAIDSTHVYWTEKNMGTPSFVQVRKVPIDGGTVTTLTESLYGFFFTGIAIDNDSVYFAYLDPNSSVYRIAKVSKNGGAVTPLFSSSNYKTDVEVDSTHVYWIEITEPVPGELVGEIKRIPINGGQEDTLATGLYDPKWIALDSENVYWAEFADENFEAGAIKKVPKSGGVESTLKSDLNGPYDIAVYDNYVYWTEQGTDGTDGAIRKISKNTP